MADHDDFDWQHHPPGQARRHDPETSKVAAALAPTRRLFQLVLWALDRRRWTGGTTHEIEDLTGCAAGSITPRMAQLERLGVVRREGTRVPAGHIRRQTIWHIVGGLPEALDRLHD